MDDVNALVTLIENITIGGVGIGSALFAVVVFAMWSFLRNSNKSLNANLDMINQFSTWATTQAEKRNDTQSSLDIISGKLLETSIEFERFKAHHETEITRYETRATSLEDSVQQYKRQCSETIKTVMSQLDQHSAREKKLQAQIDSLMEQNKELTAQNHQLMQIITTLREENDRLKNERAGFEIKTARTMARLEAHIQMLNEKQGDNHESGKRVGTNNIKQDTSGGVLGGSATDNSV